MTKIELNWASAEVEDGTLTLGLEGQTTSSWKSAFEMTEKMLGGGEWGKVRVKKQSVRVSDVTPGSEEKLRHHLESVVEQANATVRATEPEADERADDAGDHDSPDARMTETFRAFARDSGAETPAP